MYALPPREFVASRTTEVAALKQAGDADGARAVAALRRPGVAVGLVNAVVREHPGLVDELRDVGRRLRAASVGGDPDDVRAVDRERRTTIRRCVTAAEEVADGWGAPASAAILRDVEQTFWAALVDVAAFATVRGGALLTPLAPNGFGDVDVSGASAVPVDVEEDPPVARRAPRPRQEKQTEAVQDVPDEGAVDDEALVAARDQVATSEHDLDEARRAAVEASERAAAAGGRVVDLKDELAAVRRRLVEVEGELRDAGTEERRASAGLKDAERVRRTAGEALERARRAVRALDP
ncbi:hypothetical protein AERO_11205 [Aeromicrobium fastidiosum]|uniref:hypothetical protein n=1 Tax=Aeromicrobium fastidiosum TaxID=52699 RepID=UPI00202344BA|nr:hypothetical protein [Aeromicrobium fastidiosum]MCL8251954.1 hypothetical protein [Aeromicrobium fastidiosum]